MTAAPIVLDGVTWTPDGRREPTLRDVTCRIPAGARVAVLGPSGAGKSTLLRALAGVLEASGTGTLTGSVSAPTAGLLLQDPLDGLVAETVGRDVAFGPENLSLPREEIWSRVHDAVARVDLPVGLERSTRALSGGQQQRLQLAGALAMQPSLLLLDEPTAMLDDASAASVRSAVADTLVRTGATMFVVEHRIADWLDLVDHVLLLDRGGTLVAWGPSSQVLAQHHDDLVAAGAWLPGLPAPEPVGLPDGLLTTAPGAVLICDAPAVVRGGTTVGGATFTAAGGDVVALTGPSGSGKSTMLDLILGALVPDAGTVTPDPMTRSSRQAATTVGYVPQHPGLGFTSGTVREEMLATPRALGIDATDRARILLDHFGLTALAGASPHSLSGGEQRRLSLAVALMADAPLMVADEPSVGQDRNTWAVVAGTIEGVGRAGHAVVLASHDDDLVALATRRVDLATSAATADVPAPSRRPATRCRPLALLVAAFVVAVASLFVTTPAVAAVAAGVLALSLPLYLPSRAVTRARSAPMALAALSVGWSSWLLGGHHAATAITAMVRILFMVLPGALLMSFIEPSELGDDLAQRLGLPARPVMAVVISLQRIDHLRQTWRRLAVIRHLRGLVPDGPVGRARATAAMTFALLVDSLRSAATTAVAMDARGFADARRRTWALPSRWGAAEWCAVAVAVVAAATVVVAWWLT